MPTSSQPSAATSNHAGTAMHPLLIAAIMAAQAVPMGAGGLRRAGRRGDFMSFREYQGGESMTRMAWKLSCRTDKLYVRERESARAPLTNMWVDNSPIMHRRHDSIEAVPTKSEAAHILLLALANILLRSEEHVAWSYMFAPAISTKDEHATSIPRKITLEAASELPTLAGQILPPASCIEALPPLLPCPRYSEAVLASAFDATISEWRNYLTAMLTTGVQGILIHMTDNKKTDQSVTSAAIKELATTAGWHYLPHGVEDDYGTTIKRLCDIIASGVVTAT